MDSPGEKKDLLLTFSRLIPLLLSLFLSSIDPGKLHFLLCYSPFDLSHIHTLPHTPPLYPYLSLPRSLAMSASGYGAPGGASGSASSTKKPFPHVDLQGNDLPPSPAPSSPHAGRRYNIATELVFTEGGDQYNASSVPIYQV